MGIALVKTYVCISLTLGVYTAPKTNDMSWLGSKLGFKVYFLRQNLGFFCHVIMLHLQYECQCNTSLGHCNGFSVASSQKFGLLNIK